MINDDNFEAMEMYGFYEMGKNVNEDTSLWFHFLFFYYKIYSKYRELDEL